VATHEAARWSPHLNLDLHLNLNLIT
jgi:hypothetical protein